MSNRNCKEIELEVKVEREKTLLKLIILNYLKRLKEIVMDWKLIVKIDNRSILVEKLSNWRIKITDNVHKND